MPIIKIKKCFKFGKRGKKYCGKNARQKAVKQGRAISINKRKKK